MSLGFIAYNEASRLGRRRFTIAQELGHFLMPLHGANAQCAKADMGILTTKDYYSGREFNFRDATLIPTHSSSR